ncbi:DUF406 family protein [Alginatibacterium sediminis]|uniref:DUF406 family protein n=1 Tax=Alginatibacterium sediminis TaxID=2164068 RepID=A0A420EG36_9ALTE|nr:DUF406 family protein [Alginatibacterium sediminis]RKF19669.1 DUF406 family protein [Alginatibacterium sediminis]
MQTKLEESKTCCCVDVGAIIDGEELVASADELYANQESAQARLEDLSAKARRAESDPCVIEHSFETQEDGVRLRASFTFCNQAESLIFQLGMNR